MSDSSSSNKWIIIVAILGVFLLLGCCGVGFVFLFLAGREAQPMPPASHVEMPPAAHVEVSEEAPAAHLDHQLTLMASRTDAAKIAEAASILKDRLARAGIPGRVEVLGDNRIRVQLEKARLGDAMALLLAGGDLQFKLVAKIEGAERDKEIKRILDAKQVGEYDPAKESYDVGRLEQTSEPVLLENPGVDGYLIAKVYGAKDNRNLGAIGFEFGDQGRERFRKLTGENLQRNLAIVLDGVVKSAPTIQSEINGSGIITQNNGFSQQEVDSLVTILRSGKLPIELTLEDEQPFGE